MTDKTEAKVTAGSTDDAPTLEVLIAMNRCARAWDPQARLLGNVRAIDMARALEWAVGEKSDQMKKEDPKAYRALLARIRG